MKTINKTLALLFAAVAFTACTNQPIEPMRPATQPQSVVRPDTASGPYRIVSEEDERPVKPQRGKVTTTDAPDRNDYQPQRLEEPTPKPMPRLAVQPVAQADTLMY